MSDRGLTYDDPPPKFRHAYSAGHDVFYEFGAQLNPIVWHWCISAQLWCDNPTTKHYVIQLEPLHLEPSLRWPCCGKHGWIRAGVWQPA